jgi:probable HAF family extracellular repeat protein
MRAENTRGFLLPFTVLFLLFVLAGCGGGGGGSSDGKGNPGPAGEKESDVSGIWSLHLLPLAKGVCDEPMADSTVKIIQQGDVVTVKYPDGNQFTGSVDGDTITWSGSPAKDGGILNFTAVVHASPEDSGIMSGTITWEWSGDGGPCSGSASVTATKVSSLYAISGTVSDSNGSGLEGLTITISSGDTLTTATGGNGSYTFTGLTDGAYTVSPVQTGFTFDPASREVTMHGASVSGISFKATLGSGSGYYIYGTIAGADGTPLPDVTISINNGAKLGKTNGSGNYGIGGFSEGSYVVTPILKGYLFNPGSRSVTITNAHEAADFISYPSTYPVRYTITDLGVLPGYSSSYASAVNNSGQVAGQLVGVAQKGDVPYSRSHAFLYSQGVMADIGTLAGAYDNYPICYNSYACGINGAGQIVGYSIGTYMPGQGFWYKDGTMSDLGFAGAANGINDTGRIVGYRDPDIDDEDSYAIMLENGPPADLGPLQDYEYSCALDINNSNQAVGYSYKGLAPAYQRAFLCSGGTMYTLGVLQDDVTSSATRINDRGDVIGSSSPDPDQPLYHAFLYRDGHMADLGTLYPGDSGCAAYGINNLGQVVGSSCGTDMKNGMVVYHAFLSSGGAMVDLDSLIDFGLGWRLESATDINDKGQIVGYGLTADGSMHAFLMTPVGQ